VKLLAAQRLMQSLLFQLTNDISNIFLSSDSGTGIYIGKSSSSGSITIKNRMGGAKNIEIRSLTKPSGCKHSLELKMNQAKIEVLKDLVPQLQELVFSNPEDAE